MISTIKKVSGKVGIDGAIAMTVLTRVIQAGGGVIAVLLIARFLSANEQGYYYTFGSILALQVFFELGLSGIITQYAAHEFAYLKLTDNSQLVGDEYYKSRLSSLLRFCVKCFAVISFFLFFVLMAAGYYFFNKYTYDAAINWKTPWFVLCLTTCLNLFIDPILAFFDGLGEIKDMAKVRLIQKLFNIILLFIFFLLGFKLYSAAMASLVAILVNYIQIGSTDRFKILKSIWLEKKGVSINYYKEIFPFQWRIALSWISGYFIYQLFNPVLFATEGAKVAGQMGMTLAALGAISTLSMSWINTKVPLFSGLIAQKKYKELDVVFDKTINQLFIVSFIIISAFLFFLFTIRYMHLSLGERFLSPIPLLLLSSTVIVNQFISSWATYLRCHKQEPFLINSIVIGVLCMLAIFILGHKFGLMGMVVSYTFLVNIVSLIWGYKIFITKKKIWHVD